MIVPNLPLIQLSVHGFQRVVQTTFNSTLTLTCDGARAKARTYGGFNNCWATSPVSGIQASLHGKLH